MRFRSESVAYYFGVTIKTSVTGSKQRLLFVIRSPLIALRYLSCPIQNAKTPHPMNWDAGVDFFCRRTLSYFTSTLTVPALIFSGPWMVVLTLA